MRRLFLIALAACGSNSTPPPTGPIAATVTHYDYTIDLTSLAAHVTVTATITTAGDCWTLPFRASNLANVALNSAPELTQTTSDATTLTACSTGFSIGTPLVLDADMTVPLATLETSQVGYSVTNDSDHNPFDYMLSWVNECDRFGPCDNAPDQFATYHFDVTHDASLTVRCPGTITDVSTTETVCDFEEPGGPTYSTFSLAASPAWIQTDMGMWGDVHVTVYDRASTGVAAAIDPVWHGGFVTWMESELGQYPYGTELRVLTGPTYFNGFEHPGNIVLSDTLKKQLHPAYANNTAHTLDHEITHMWAGNQTTLAGTYDFAWKESMAEYMAFVWEDMNDEAISTVSAYAWKSFATSAMYFPVPDDKPALFDYYGDVYGPGPMVLFRQLEVMTSRAQVLAAIQSVLGMQHALSMDDLLTALSAQTGLDLTAYAAGWIHGTGRPSWPRFMLTFTAGAAETSTLVVHQINQQAGTPRGCKFHIALHSDEGMPDDQAQQVEVDTFTNGADQTLTVPTPAFTVASIQIDPLNECLVFLDSSSPRVAPVHPWRSELGELADRQP